jgi:pimeloyl-ACP methyl ester carboxylesterase
MADDLVALMHEHLSISTRLHIVGHDIGGMIAHAYASPNPERVASIIWGECPLPGTKALRLQ